VCGLESEKEKEKDRERERQLRGNSNVPKCRRLHLLQCIRSAIGPHTCSGVEKARGDKIPFLTLTFAAAERGRKEGRRILLLMLFNAFNAAGIRNDAHDSNNGRSRRRATQL
jgi:hypothetical protein